MADRMDPVLARSTERIINTDQGLRDQGFLEDVGDAWRTSLPYLGLDFVSDLIDPAETHLDADYMSGGWQNYVQDPSERGLFSGLLNEDQADRLREDLDVRRRAMMGQQYDSMVYTFGVSLLPELLNPINYVTGGLFGVTRAGTSTVLRTAGSMARVSALTSAVEVGAVSQFAPYIDDEELAEMFMTATIAGTVIGTGMVAGGRGIAGGIRYTAPSTARAAANLGAAVRRMAPDQPNTRSHVVETGESIIDYPDDGAVFVRPRQESAGTDPRFWNAGTPVRESWVGGKQSTWVWDGVRNDWRLSAESVATSIRGLSISDGTGVADPLGGLFVDTLLPDGSMVKTTKYAPEHLRDLGRMTFEKGRDPILTENADPEVGGLTATWADGTTMTIRELRKGEGAEYVGRLDQAFADIPNLSPADAADLVARLNLPDDIGIQEGGAALSNWLTEFHLAMRSEDVLELPEGQRTTKAREMATERLRASRASRDYLRANWLQKLSVVWTPINRIPKGARDNNQYMTTLQKIAGQFESMSAANAAGMESSPSVLMKSERHIAPIGRLRAQHASLYAEYQTGSTVGVGGLSRDVRNAASNMQTGMRQYVAGKREGEMDFNEFGMAAADLYISDFNTEFPHPIYGVLPPQVEQMARHIQEVFAYGEKEMRSSGLLKSQNEMRARVAELRREYTFSQDSAVLAQVTELEARLNVMLETPLGKDSFGHNYFPHMFRKDVIKQHDIEFQRMLRDDHFMHPEGAGMTDEAAADRAAWDFLNAYLSDPDLTHDPSRLLPSAAMTHGRKLRLDTRRLIKPFEDRQVSFIEDDLSGVMLSYMRKTGVRVEMQRMFGEPDATSTIENVRQHLIQSGLSEKDTLHAEQVMLTMRDRLLGAQHVLPYDHWARRTRAAAGNYVNAAVLGGSVITQLADYGNMIARVGGVNAAKMMAEHITGNMPKIKKAAHGLQLAELMQWQLSTAVQRVAEGDYTAMSRTSRISGWSERQMDKFFKMNLMTPVNQLMKDTAVRFNNHAIIEDAFKAKRSSKAQARLARLGFSPKDIENLRKFPHSKSQNGVYWPEYERWTGAEGGALFEKLRDAAYAEATNIVVTPGPLNRWQISEGIIPSRSKLADARVELQRLIDLEDASRELLQGHMRDARAAGNFHDPTVTRERNALREALQERSSERRMAHSALGKDSRIQTPATILLSMSTMLLSFPIASMTKITHALGSGASGYPVQGVAAFMLMGMIVDYLKTPDWAWDEKEPAEKLVRSMEISGLMGMFEQTHGIVDKMGFGMRSALGLDIPFVEEGNEGAEIAQDIAGVGWSLGYDLVDKLTDGDATTYEQARAIQRVIPLTGMIWWRDTLRDVTWSLTNDNGE